MSFMISEYKRKLLKIAIPIMLSSLISQFQMLIDRVFLGRMGILYMSAVGNATAPIWTSMSFIFSLSVGASVLISQAVGSKDFEKAKEYAGAMVKFNNIIPVLLFIFWEFFSPLIYKLMGVPENVFDLCVTYTRVYAPVFLILGISASYSVIFQTSNLTLPLVWYGIIRSACNVFLDYVLIFGKLGFPQMGIKGAALGTAIAEYVGFVFIAYVSIVKRKDFLTSPSLRKMIREKIGPYLKSMFKGLPTASEDFLWNFGNLMIISILNTISDKAAGIYSMVFAVEIIFIVIICSIGNGTLTVSGEATGAKDLSLYRRVVGTSLKWSMYVSVVTLAVFALFPRQILGFFTTDKAVIEESVMLLIMLGINLFGKSSNIIIGNGIRGYGDTMWMLITQILGTVQIVCLAALFVFVFKMGVAGVFVATILDELLRGGINTIRFFKIKF